MGQTISEKILAKASGKAKVSPGEYIQVTSPCIVPIAGDLKTQFVHDLNELGATKVFDPERIVIVMDHCGSSTAHKSRENALTNRELAKQIGIPTNNLIDLGRQGIGHVLAAEKCWPLPGSLYLSGTDGHTPTLGGLGAFALPLSYEEAAYLVTGETWLRVPESLIFDLSGILMDGVMARDVFEYILGQIGPDGAPYQVMEFSGTALNNISIDGRLSLCCNAIFTGAKTAIVSPDQKTIDYVKSNTAENFEVLTSDPDADYAGKYNFDLSQIEPQVVIPPKRHIIKPVSDVAGTAVDVGFIGSCTNSRLEDMRIAAKILKGRKIHRDFRLNITPGSTNVYLQALREGLIEIFIEAGAVIPTPACGMCGGFMTPLAGNESCISTGTCNYPGRMGSMDAQIHLGNPATVAASAIECRITDPRRYL